MSLGLNGLRRNVVHAVRSQRAKTPRRRGKYETVRQCGTYQGKRPVITAARRFEEMLRRVGPHTRGRCRGLFSAFNVSQYTTARAFAQRYSSRGVRCDVFGAKIQKGSILAAKSSGTPSCASRAARVRVRVPANCIRAGQMDASTGVRIAWRAAHAPSRVIPARSCWRETG